MTGRKPPAVSSSIEETAAGRRSRLFGVITTSGRARLLLDLTAQQMEVLRGRRRVADLHVVLGAELQIAFEPRARVLRPLPLVAVREQEDEARSLLPLVPPGAMNWSMMTCAPFAKSPNCASHMTSASGASTE